jgi:hypothetical protein
MALFFKQKIPRERPQLHALIIGVGHYPYMDAVKDVLARLPPLVNLHSPPVSAERLANWLIDHQSWLNGVELGTVDLLVSKIPSEPTGRHRSIRNTAGHAAIVKAFDGWFKRCDAHPDNVALFYFCGHGLQKESLILLPQDFLRYKTTPWATPIDFNATYRGMSSCAAKTQYFIIDACRQWSGNLLRDYSFGGTRLGRHIADKVTKRTAPALYGTASGNAAFGDTSGKPSRLTEALIACMEGSAAEKVNDQWQIKVFNLGPAVQEFVRIANRSYPDDEHQTVDPTIVEGAAGNRTLLLLPDSIHPRVLVEFGCEPIEATEHAQFYYEGVRPMLPECGADCVGPWSTELLAGYYHFVAKIEHPEFVGNRIASAINPPFHAVSVRVTKKDAPGKGGRR